MHHDLCDLGSLILIQIIPKEPNLGCYNGHFWWLTQKKKNCVVEFFVLIFSTVDSSVRLSSVLLVFESSHWHQAELN